MLAEMFKRAETKLDIEELIESKTKNTPEEEKKELRILILKYIRDYCNNALHC